MKIWFINQSNMPPEYGHFNRHYNFGKFLKKAGHEPVVLAGSYLHNTDIQLIKDKSLTVEYKGTDYPFLFVRTAEYARSKVRQVLTMFEFYFNVKKAVRKLERPDAIIGSSPHPLAAIEAIRLGRKLGCQSVVEIRDLWPESFLAYGIMKKNNPLLKLLYAGEKWIYKKADKIVFTMEGGRDYIKARGWDKESGGPIDLDKVYHINNGVDLAVFDRDVLSGRLEDKDLEDEESFKVIYAGSIRRANNLDRILDAAIILKESKIRFLIYGEGNEKEKLMERCRKEDIDNVVFKGKIDKLHIPYILSRSNLNILNYPNHEIWKYGGSQNKIFDYLASGKPVLSTISMGYDIIKRFDAGISLESQTPMDIAEGIVSVAELKGEDYQRMCANARKAAVEYDFNILTEKLLKMLKEDKK